MTRPLLARQQSKISKQFLEEQTQKPIELLTATTREFSSNIENNV